MRAPNFWKDKNALSTALLPFAGVYALAAKTCGRAPGIKLSVPVICVGNVVAGGAGKTPVALAVGALYKAQGKRPHYLTRGYKGRLCGPVQVDPEKHTAHDVGDEPLLLARVLPTWVARDRVAGAKAAIAAGAELLIMDDGFQNPALAKDISLLVVDGGYGFGNGRLIPAGPLREPVARAALRATAIVLVDEDTQQVSVMLASAKPLLRARLEPSVAAHALKDKSVVAFAGIARPHKFHRTLQQLGCHVKKMIAYPDHYFFTTRDIASLRDKAKEEGAILVTTAKDHVRLSPDIRSYVTSVPVEMVFEDNDALRKLLSL